MGKLHRPGFASAACSATTYLADSSDNAARIVEELVRCVDRLAQHPQLGRVVPEYGQWQLRELVDRWNRVLYRLRSDAVEVVTIVPTRIPLDEGDAEDE